MYTIAMLFVHLRTLYTVYSMYSSVSRLRVLKTCIAGSITGLGIVAMYCMYELGRDALEERRHHREMVKRRKNRMKVQARNTRLVMRSQNAKLKADKATLQVEIHKKDIRMVTLQMKERELEEKIKKYEDREALMEAFGLIPSKKSA
jgi:hypothetical protein